MDDLLELKMRAYEMNAIAELCELATMEAKNPMQQHFKDMALDFLETLTIARRNDAHWYQG